MELILPSVIPVEPRKPVDWVQKECDVSEKLELMLKEESYGNTLEIARTQYREFLNFISDGDQCMEFANQFFVDNVGAEDTYELQQDLFLNHFGNYHTMNPPINERFQYDDGGGEPDIIFYNYEDACKGIHYNLGIQYDMTGDIEVFKANSLGRCVLFDKEARRVVAYKKNGVLTPIREVCIANPDVQEGDIDLNMSAIYLTDAQDRIMQSMWIAGTRVDIRATFIFNVPAYVRTEDQRVMHSYAKMCLGTIRNDIDRFVAIFVSGGKKVFCMSTAQDVVLTYCRCMCSMTSDTLSLASEVKQWLYNTMLASKSYIGQIEELLKQKTSGESSPIFANEIMALQSLHKELHTKFQGSQAPACAYLDSLANPGIYHTRERQKLLLQAQERKKKEAAAPPRKAIQKYTSSRQPRFASIPCGEFKIVMQNDIAEMQSKMTAYGIKKNGTGRYTARMRDHLMEQLNVVKQNLFNKPSQ